MPRHVAHVPVRWSDLDALGRVDSVVFLRYLQEARVDMLFVQGRLPGADRLTAGLVVAAHDIEFREPLRWRVDPVRVESWVSDVRNSSFTVQYEVADVAGMGERVVYAVASTMLVPYDLAGQHPRRLDANEKSALEELRQ